MLTLNIKVIKRNMGEIKAIFFDACSAVNLSNIPAMVLIGKYHSASLNAKENNIHFAG